MGWKESLDKYLTNEPDDGFGSWSEIVCDSLSDEFWEKYESIILGDIGTKILNKIFDKSSTDAPEESARIIERIFSLYKVKPQID